jgi:hypothetical protein
MKPKRPCELLFDLSVHQNSTSRQLPRHCLCLPKASPRLPCSVGTNCGNHPPNRHPIIGPVGIDVWPKLPAKFRKENVNPSKKSDARIHRFQTRVKKSLALNASGRRLGLPKNVKTSSRSGTGGILRTDCDVKASVCRTDGTYRPRQSELNCEPPGSQHSESGYQHAGAKRYHPQPTWVKSPPCPRNQ